MKVVQELLRHSDIALTLGRYSHLLPPLQKDIVDRWDDIFRYDNETDEEEK